MWRALFLAMGIYCCILGLQGLAIDKAVMKARSGEGAAPREVRPPDWAPWSLMSGGVVVSIYSFTLKRQQG